MHSAIPRLSGLDADAQGITTSQLMRTSFGLGVAYIDGILTSTLAAIICEPLTPEGAALPAMADSTILPHGPILPSGEIVLSAHSVRKKGH